MFGGHPNLAVGEPKQVVSTENEGDHVKRKIFIRNEIL